MSAKKIFINMGAQEAASAFVRSFTDAGAANPFQMAESDSFDIDLHFLQPNSIPTPNRPFVYVDPVAWSGAKFAMGAIGATPDGGTFTLTSSLGGGASGALAYTATAAAVQAALRALSGGGLTACTVTGNNGGPWSIDSNATTDPTLEITGSAAALAPDGSTVVISKTQTANGSLTNRWIISLAKALPVLNTTWSALPAADVNVDVVQAGAADANKAFRAVWNQDAYYGGVLLSFFNGTDTFTVGPIAYNAQSSDVAAAFAALGAGNEVTVVQNALGDFTITCTGDTIKLSDDPTLDPSSDTLVVPVGLRGTITASTAGVANLLNGETSVEVYLEIEIRQSVGQPETVAQISNAVFIADLISNTPGFATGSEDWATIGDVRAISAVTFADITARGSATPEHVGQLGVQLDTGNLYEGTALSAGSWSPVRIETLSTGVAGSVNGTLRMFNASNGFGTTITSPNATADRTLTAPDESGTIALIGGGGAMLPAQGGTGIANNNASTITISGNFATTFTVTGTTGVTLPTTGTLATLSGSETLSGKTLTAPKIASTGFIADANGNEQIVFVTTASAVNEFTITNAATGNPPELKASGSNTDISIKITPKGAGTTIFGGTTAQIAFGGVTASDGLLQFNGSSIRCLTGNAGAFLPFTCSNLNASGTVNAQGGTIYIGLTDATAPSWWASGTIMRCRLADNSAFAPIAYSGVQAGVVAAKTSAYTATSQDFFIPVDATSGSVTITLPAAASHSGRILNIKKIDASGNSVIIDGNSSETIDGATTQTTTTQWFNWTIISNGTAWFIL